MADEAMAGTTPALDDSMSLAGQRLASRVCATNIIVLQAGRARAVPECGGVPMVSGLPIPCGEPEPGVRDAAETVAGTVYADPATGLLVRCTRSGSGRLTLEGRPLRLVQRHRMSFRVW